jgi:glyoxylase-like metal-dependent hydrolase (beta-lactamase superfamily II)
LLAEVKPESMVRIRTIDCQYLHPEFAAAYLLIDDGMGDEKGAGTGAPGCVTAPHPQARAVFIDNNTAHSVPLLLKALQEEGLSPEQVEYVIITHVHLDHAGGTSQLMKACPNAVLLAHPKAARHMIDPAKLVASARNVYGDQAFDEMYGRIDPIPASRVRTMEDNQHLSFGPSATELRFLHTRGHANHHFCIEIPGLRAIFTGDAFGLAYPALQKPTRFILPTTSPTDFNYPEAVASIDRIVETGATTAYLTHYGAITDLASAAAELKRHLAFSQALLIRAAESSFPDSELASFCEKELRSHYAAQILRDPKELLKIDLELNAAGLAHAARKKPRP